MTDLVIWTVFDHPSDFPDVFIARKSHVNADGLRISQEAIASADLTALRRELAGRGLTSLGRLDDDEPHIVEVWL